MLVYREQGRSVQPAAMLAAARGTLDQLAACSGDLHDPVVGLLIELGMLESAVTDYLSPEVEHPHPRLEPLRAATIATGHMLWHSWHGRRHAMDPWIARTRAAIDAARARMLPHGVTVNLPEGFTQYGLYPETYFAAAVKAARAHPIPTAVCIGVRSIGTSLAAVVTAALEELGRDVLSLTVRPHGHPFDRRPRLGDAIVAMLRERQSSVFLLVDEGPGISGSSLAGAARVLTDLGVEEDHVVLLPSWRTDGSALRSAEARARWGRHPQFTATFEEVWTGRLRAIVPGYTLQDLSAGAWRSVLLQPGRALPAVQPQHERRKYAARPCAPSDPARRELILRFAGLGAFGEPKRARAEALAGAGFGAPPVALRHGFLVCELLPGTPASPADRNALAPIMAAYLAYLRHQWPAVGPATELGPMVTTNVTELLGPRAADHAMTRWNSLPRDVPPTALDGRLLPYEWVRTEVGYRKVDAVDHGDDHFYPGPQDIAWDVAGACLEFDFSSDLRRSFVDTYRRQSGDHTIAERLPGYAVAYLAFRAGYATLAGEQLGTTADGSRFRAQADAYRRRLARELAEGREAWAP